MNTFRKLLLLCWALLVPLVSMAVSSMPKVSTDKEVHWYLLKFTNSGMVVEAAKANAGARQAAMTGIDAQLWKVEGSAAAGYTITNKLGCNSMSPILKKWGWLRLRSNPPRTINSRLLLAKQRISLHRLKFILKPTNK